MNPSCIRTYLPIKKTSDWQKDIRLAELMTEMEKEFNIPHVKG
jgi:hypothetical protein